MRSIARGTAAALAGVAVLCLWAPAQAVAGPDAARSSAAYCGPDKATGLAVWADPADSCATALQVASAYAKARSGTARVPVTVRTDGGTWTCQERQGDPNPYQECVDTGGSGRRVVLSS
ncbi:hypothetical protein ACFY71_10410 [Streptomyces cinerochromogenes]|uniref:hypothetical protein n=1 Tax=Streptomyces cinerochromogenes TaxID=66422 RepID=UPI00368EDC6A